jgi:hypothetical protein
MKVPRLLFIAAALSVPAQAALVAYFPVTDTDTSRFLDDVIDDPTHGTADGVTTSNAGSIVFDATRGGFVVSTVQGHRYTAGIQDADLSKGFTWSLWVKSNSTANADAGADVIIGSRSGIWNKVQPAGTARWFDLGYNIDDDTWHHIVYTASSALGGAFWIDGAKVATDPTPFQGKTYEPTKLEIGGASQFTEDWTGLMDDISIWNEVLDDERLIALSQGWDPIRISQIPETTTCWVGLLGALMVCRRRRN